MDKLFIFGSTGDLVKRKILPALHDAKFNNLEIFAIGRRDFLKEIYIKKACFKGCTIQERIHYFKADFENEDICEECEKNLSKKQINYFYVSLPPNLFEVVLKKINKINKKGYKTKILLEKPFGSSLKEAKKIYSLIKKFSMEKDVFLADHYLFKKTILEIEKKDFKKLKIIALEKLGLENRITYYDSVGAIKDMIQSHLLNIAFKFLTEKEINDLKIIKLEKKQYVGYEKELGKKSKTETYAKLILGTNGKEIELETGKKHEKKITKIIIDNKKINIVDDNAYVKMIYNFINNKKENFPKIEQVLKSWKIIEKINKKTIL